MHTTLANRMWLDPQLFPGRGIVEAMAEEFEDRNREGCCRHRQEPSDGGDLREQRINLTPQAAEPDESGAPARHGHHGHHGHHGCQGKHGKSGSHGHAEDHGHRGDDEGDHGKGRHGKCHKKDRCRHRQVGDGKPEPKDDFVSSKHQIVLDGERISYTATTGRMVLREEEYNKKGEFVGFKPRAQLYITSYVVDSDVRRPVTFAFNGGPGSSSVWLHMGLLGPRRVVCGDVGNLSKPPYGIVDNEDSLLKVSDLVIIDPSTTGYSRSVEGTKPDDYLGFKGDIESVAEVIRLWVTRNKRWLSPKFIAGESYGTIRAAALADYLQQECSMYLNGLMLISSCLDFNSLDFSTDRSYVDFLPTYAAIAWYHGKHEGRSLHDVIDEAREYADREFGWVLNRGNRLTEEERAAAVRKVAQLTGLSERYVDYSDLRIEHMHYFAELLRDEGLCVGRLDSRFTTPLRSRLQETMEVDALDANTSGSYIAAWHHYVRDELNYENDSPYQVFSDIAWKKWSYKEFEGRSVSVVDKLESALRTNPDLQIQVQYGYFDGGTPFFSAEDVIAHLKLPKGLEKNFEHKYYESGHMIYIHEESRSLEARDMADFIKRHSNI